MFIARVVPLVASLVMVLWSPQSRAQFAVIDVGAIAQLIQQVQTLREQVETARNQLNEARSTLAAMRGGRGMEQLLSDQVRNYLPPSWVELEAVMRQASAEYGALSRELERLVEANAVLTPVQLERFAAVDREQLEADRRTSAMLQVTTRHALATSSERFSRLQQLINAIPNASDQKAILDLQARIAVEQGMLVNEQTKLQVLFQAAQAEELARQQRVREQAIASIGSLRRLPPMGL